MAEARVLYTLIGGGLALIAFTIALLVRRLGRPAALAFGTPQP